MLRVYHDAGYKLVVVTNEVCNGIESPPAMIFIFITRESGSLAARHPTISPLSVSKVTPSSKRQL